MNRRQSYTNGQPILYLIATPIGNLQEFTPRAIEILSTIDHVGCEDTRNTKSLFDKFGIKCNLISCHEHNENEASIQLLEYMKQGQNIAYCSDAGYPGISDPCSRLVNKVLEAGYNVSVISGSCAFINALVASGLDTSHFYFHGFLQSKESARINELKELVNKKETLIFYESPHRINKTLTNMDKILGNRKICIARELTKKFEEYTRGTLDEFVNLPEDTFKGEMVVIVEGQHIEQSEFASDEDIMAYVNNLTEVGLSTKDAIKNAAATFKINKNYIYKIIHGNN
ncbi:MAG: 16S rRNA (cytidine(1402)-2'-O)-methyltransferase [Bacilli bacterium]|nr:16S rRNA (cytidine(1402)-2'-O)-methyltransferase [Bacilli bacterium]